MFRMELRAAMAAMGLASAQGSVWVVDPAGMPGFDFLDLQAGIDAAAPGDVVLVRTGTFPRLALDGKGITNAAELGADVRVSFRSGPQPSFVANVPASEVTVLRGLRPSTDYCSSWFGPPALRIEGCDGPVWIEDCAIEGHGPEALRVVDAALVAMQRCAVTGTNGKFGGVGGWPAGAGLTIEGGFVSAYESTFTGGDGLGAFVSRPHIVSAEAGADACAIEDGSLVAVGCAFRGGAGGNGAPHPWVPGACLSPAAGGNGLSLGAGAPSVYVADSTAQGGAGGTSPCSVSAPSGSDIVASTGAVVPMAGLPARPSTTSPVREGQALVTTIATDPDSYDLALWAYSPDVEPVRRSSRCSS